MTTLGSISIETLGFITRVDGEYKNSKVILERIIIKDLLEGLQRSSNPKVYYWLS
jgi:hypothetical protein